jgi:hypothetical protein
METTNDIPNCPICTEECKRTKDAFQVEGQCGLHLVFHPGCLLKYLKSQVQQANVRDGCVQCPVCRNANCYKFDDAKQFLMSYRERQQIRLGVVILPTTTTTTTLTSTLFMSLITILSNIRSAGRCVGQKIVYVCNMKMFSVRWCSIHVHTCITFAVLIVLYIIVYDTSAQERQKNSAIVAKMCRRCLRHEFPYDGCTTYYDTLEQCLKTNFESETGVISLYIMTIPFLVTSMILNIGLNSAVKSFVQSTTLGLLLLLWMETNMLEFARGKHPISMVVPSIFLVVCNTVSCMVVVVIYLLMPITHHRTPTTSTSAESINTIIIVPEDVHYSTDDSDNPDNSVAVAIPIPIPIPDEVHGDVDSVNQPHPPVEIDIDGIHAVTEM